MARSPITSVFLQSVPHTSGVYLMKNGQGDVLYVGKARDLRNRLSSYRSSAAKQFAKTAAMLRKVVLVETILTRTEKEALILEASLIKKLHPRYNVILRDDKNYPYIKVTVNERWPRVFVARRRQKDGGRYFGPYSSSSAMRDTLTLLQELLPLRSCRGAKVKKRMRPCLNQQLGLCPAPCCQLADPKEYQAVVKSVIRILEGRKSELAGYLEAKMAEAAKIQDFEKAAVYRDKRISLLSTLEKQAVAAGHSRNQDIFGLARKEFAASVAVIFVREGLVVGQQAFYLNTVLGTDEDLIDSCIQQFYGDDRYIPAEILVSHKPARGEILAEWLTDLREAPVHLKTPQRGKLLELINMAVNNATQVFAEEEKKSRTSHDLLTAVARTLKLARNPDRIECLDISNTDGKQAVGSLVSFKNGEPDKKNYRHYRITGGDTPDDYGMMREVLLRRFAGDAARTPPDLLLIDGGKGHLNVAVQALKETNHLPNIDLLAIAKERKGEGEKLFRPGRKNPFLLPVYSPVLLLMMRIRDESHRFGITFHRRLRNKSTLKSGLDLVPGVGPVRRQLLLRKFGSLKQMKKASFQELIAVEGVGPELARCIIKQLQSTE